MSIRKKAIYLIVALILVLNIVSPTVDRAEEITYAVTKVEAESALGKYAVGDSGEASGGKYIGIDYSLGTDGKYNYRLIFENMPETTTFSMMCASPHGGELIIYSEKDGKQEVIGSILYDATGGWDPFGATGFEVAEKIYIPEGSKIIMVTTSTLNIDYFEFKFHESEVPVPGDGKQADDVKDKQNVFISDLNYIHATRVEKDLTYAFSSLSVAGNTYEKGLCMSAGHFPGSEYVEINIEGLGFTTFASYAGVDDSTNTAYGKEPSVKFYVEVDGVIKAESEVLGIGDDPVLLKCDITGGKVLKLYTSPVDDEVGTDICVWGNAALGKSDNPDEIFATPEPTPSPTPKPTAEITPTSTKSSTETTSEDNSKTIIYVIAAIAVVAIVVIAIALISKKKK